MENRKIIIVGAPNVGKSSIFNSLTGRYATVSNYPGTTVELFKATVKIKEIRCEIVDTPGMYSFLTLSEEEKISSRIIINDNPDVVIHVGAATNLERALPLTLQLIESGLPVIFVLNIMDEAQKEGLVIDCAELEKILGIPVVTAVSVRNEGIKELRDRISEVLKREGIKADSGPKIEYPEIIREAVKSIAGVLEGRYTLSKHLLSLLFLQSDSLIGSLIKKRERGQSYLKADSFRRAIKKKVSQPLEYLVNLAIKEKTVEIVRKVVSRKKAKSESFARILGEWTLKPFVGLALLGLFLYFGIYKLVGEIGAGVCVDFLEKNVFEAYINPFFIFIFDKFVPYEQVNSLFVGEYGIVTLGLRYAVAIVFPIVGIFFFVFSFAEDTGYLPRVGAMLDRVFKKVGLSGRAVIPMVLGLGCDTMATMVTRILPTRRERVIATFLLSLSVPCSAQLGVIMAVLSGKGLALLIWFLVISFVFTCTGVLLNKILKGRRPSFNIEIPPLRMPRFRNIFTKTYVRLKWYFKEVLPIFIWASVFIWAGQVTKIFDMVLMALSGPLRLIGLPEEMSKVFLFGFFRRDYGAAGLYDLDKTGALAVRELVVAAVVLTLFLPCIAQLLMNIKERGLKLALQITLFILVFSFSVGFVLNKILVMAGM